jgi:hypothetical protein
MTGFKQERDFNRQGDQIFGQRLARSEEELNHMSIEMEVKAMEKN